jgi:MFS family permease
MLLPREKTAFTYHLAYSLIDGIILGVLALNEFVLVKSLGGTNYQISFLFQFQHVVLLFSILFHELLRKVINTRKMLTIVALITRLPLILFAFFPVNQLQDSIYPSLFLGIFLLYYLSTPIIFPAINLLLKNSYQHSNFGRFYSYSASVNKVIMMVVTFFFGIWLDINPTVYRFAYPLLGVLGILSVILLAKIPYQKAESKVAKAPVLQGLKASLKNIRHIILTNKPFRDFEIGFMFYGFAWMSTAAVITIFFSKELELNYTSLAIYKNIYNILAIALLPYFGLLLGKIDPRKFAIITFAALLVYIGFLAVTSIWQGKTSIGDFTLYYWLIPTYVGYGFFAATMALLWSIGSAYFCRPEESGYYQSLHLTLTGFRAIFAPVIGVWFYEMLGFFLTFLAGVLSLIISIAWMFVSMNRHKKLS